MAANHKTRLICLMNQKGGVGKTTTTVNLGAALARELDKRVLMIDLDPQAHMTLHLGIDPDTVQRSMYDLFTDPSATAASIVQKIPDSGEFGLHVLPAEVNLAGVESELAHLSSRGESQHVLRDKVLPFVEQEKFDFVLMDCPPSLGLLTINGLSLAGEVVVPMQAHFLALQGLSKLLETVSLMKRSLNPQLVVSGVILCMFEGNTVLAGEVVNDLKAFMESARQLDVPWRNAKVLEPPIRRNIKLAECPSFGKTIFDYAPWCPGASDYRNLANALAELSV